jgi:hypothetical protein
MRPLHFAWSSRTSWSVTSVLMEALLVRVGRI